MKSKFIILSLFLISYTFGQHITPQEYIKRFAKTAVAEQQKYGIPASITLAQGLLESGSGNSRLSKKGNNHFGVKCHRKWDGGRMYHDDDAKGECFRVYKSAWFSYRDHSKFLANGKRYQFLFRLKNTDYRGWAKGLKRAGYATNPKYPRLLIKQIERYGLHYFDKVNLDDLEGTIDFAQITRGKINGTQTTSKPKEVKVTKKNPVVIVKKTPKKKPILEKTGSLQVYIHPNGKREYIKIIPGKTLEDISTTFKIKMRKLLAYNDLKIDSKVKNGMIIFLKAKKSKAKNKYHKVKNGETMWEIAQGYNMKLESLYKKNHFKIGQEPTVGTVLFLRRIKK